MTLTKTEVKEIADKYILQRLDRITLKDKILLTRNSKVWRVEFTSIPVTIGEQKVKMIFTISDTGEVGVVHTVSIQ